MSAISDVMAPGTPVNSLTTSMRVPRRRMSQGGITGIPDVSTPSKDPTVSTMLLSETTSPARM
jgi:hypothetical protein